MGSPVKAREWEKTLTVKCRLCGGAKCKRCSESAALAKTDSPVLGLHADWVTDRVLGMMRPSSRLMKDYQITQQFHKLRISAVFNLTLPGEHPYCGDGLVTSGFPYDPEKDLMSHSIRFYNFGWEDMTTPTLSFMMDIVKVMASVLQDGHQKVAVHCHAGYGRTGLAIACVLIFMHNIPPDQAIKIVRRDRPGSVQTVAQAKFVHTFYEYINTSKVVFALPFIHDRFNVAEMVEHQNRTVHGAKTSGTSHALPRVLSYLCTEVEATANVQPAQVIHAFVNHVPFAQTDGKPSGDLQSIHEMHVNGIFQGAPPAESESGSRGGVSNGRGSNFINAASSETSASTLTPPPPVPSFPLSNLTRLITQEELFPIKVAFNVGETNWHEASALCTSAMMSPVLLLDWLEHLAEPLLDSSVLDLVIAHDGETHAVKAKALNKLPIHVVKSLDRLLHCLRMLQRKAEAIDAGVGVSASVSGITGAVLADALCARTAMAVFHISSSSSAVLARHADFVAMLARDWHAPKRLELNLESLQKLGKVPSVRKLSQSDTAKLLLEQSPTSPKTPRDYAVVLEPVVHPPRPASASASASSSPRDHLPRAKESHEAVSPVKIEPLNLHPRAPSAERPASPLKTSVAAGTTAAADALTSHPHMPPPLPEAKKDGDASVALGSPTRVALSCREKDLDVSDYASSAALGSSSSACSLPSVRGGDRYKHKHGG